MTRRSGSKGDPTIREALLAKREHLGAFLTSREAQERTEAIRSGAPVAVSTPLLAGALAYAGHPRAREFHHDADPGQVWLLDADDVLTELDEADD